MDQVTPAWLNEQFLTQCLQKEAGKENVVVTNFSATPAAPPGSNYGSCALRVNVEYREQEEDGELSSLSLITKSEVIDKVLKEMLDGLELIEPTFYNKFIPEAKKLANVSFPPKSFYSPIYSVIVLEDLKEQGYVLVDRLKRLDFDHCCLYAKAAASFHAISFAIHKENPEFIESIGKEKFYSNDVPSGQSFKKLLPIVLKCLADNTEKVNKYKKYSKVIRDTSGDMWEKLLEALKPGKGLITLNQGDPHLANMMFKYNDNGKVTQIKLFDFQGLKYSSPVCDLIFFLWTSANHDVRRNSLEQFYQIYLDNLNNNLKELNCNERMTYEDLKNMLKELTPLVMFLVAMFPALSDPAPINFGLLFKSEEEEIVAAYNKYYNESFCLNHLPNLLEQLELTGVFDYLSKM